MAGAVDLFAGISPIAGPNLFGVDKNPLNQIDTGVEDVIGQQAAGIGFDITQLLQSLINQILGMGLKFLEGLTGAPTGTLGDIETFFGNLLKFLGELDPLSPTFDPIAAAHDFLNLVLLPTHLIAPLVEDATAGLGLSGFVPMENLAVDEIESIIGSAQALIDAILATVGWLAGAGTAADVQHYFTDLLNMLGVPALTSGTFDPSAAVSTFITAMMHPLNLLAPMNPATSLLYPVNVPGLDASKIISGVLATAQIPLLAASQITSGVFNALQIPGLDATKIISGVLAIGQIPTGSLGAGNIADIQTIIDGVYQAVHGGTLTGNAATTVKTSLLNFPGANIISAIAASVVPGLDASKIITGVFTQGLIPALTSGWGGTIDGAVLRNAITTATLPGGNLSSAITNQNYIPSLTSGWVNSLAAAVIPSLDASKITTGIFSVPLIPSLPASIITSGAFATAQIPGLDASKIITGTFANSFVPGVLPLTLWQTSTVGAKNLVISPNFEDSTIDRQTINGTGTYSTTFARSGTQSYRVVTSTGTGGSHSDGFALSPNNVGNMWTLPPANGIKVQPGQWFYTEIYVRAATTNTTTGGNVTVATYLKDSTGVNANTVGQLTNNVVMNTISTSGWTKLSGWYQIPAGYDLIFPFAWMNNQTVANQTFYWDDARIVEETVGQSLTDTVVQAITGTTNTANLLPAVTSALQNIPYQYVLGLLGATQVGGTIQNFVDTSVNAIQNNTTTGNSLSVFGSALNSLTNMLGFTTGTAPPSNSVNAISVGSSQWIANTSVMRPVTVNLDVTMDSSINLDTLIPLGGTIQTVPGFQSNTGYGMVGFVSTPSGGLKQSIAWIGNPAGGSVTSTSFGVAVYRLVVNDPTYGSYWQFVYWSGDIKGSLGTGSSPVWNYYNLSSANYINTKQGELYAVVCFTFDQNYNFVGAIDNNPPQQPSLYPTRRGAALAAQPPVYGHTSTGPGFGPWGSIPTYSEPITLNANDNFVVIPVHIYFTNATPATRFDCDINGTNMPVIDSYGYYSSTTTLGIFWFGLQFTPGQFGTSATVHVNVSGGTAGQVEGHAVSYAFVSGASGYGHSSGTGTTATLTNSINGGVDYLVAAASDGAFNMGATSGSPLYQIPYLAGNHFSMSVGHFTQSVGSTSTPAFSCSVGGTAQWGFAGLYLSGTYIWPNGYTGNPTTGASYMGMSTNAPYFGLSNTLGQTQYGSIAPVLLTYYSSTTIPNPAVTYPWANHFDLVVCGGGAGGDAGGTLQGSYGGPSGNWGAITATRALMGTSNLTITIGAGGAGGNGTSVGGSSGGGSSISVPGWTTVPGGGGTGHGTSIATGSIYGAAGVSAPTYNYTNFYGGNDQFPGGAGGGTAQAAGNQAGGGGAGGNSLTYGSNIYGGNGGPGIAYIYVYQ
jgi:hypothetical protein